MSASDAVAAALAWVEWTPAQVDASSMGLEWCKAEQGESSVLFALDLPRERVFYCGDRTVAEKAVGRLLTDAGWAVRDGVLGKLSGAGADDGATFRASGCARKGCTSPGPFYAVRMLIPGKGEPAGEVPAGRCVQLVPDVACCEAHRDELARDISEEARFRRKVVDSLAAAKAKIAPDFSRMRWTFDLANVPRGEKAQ